MAERTNSETLWHFRNCMSASLKPSRNLFKVFYGENWLLHLSTHLCGNQLWIANKTLASFIKINWCSVIFLFKDERIWENPCILKTVPLSECVHVVIGCQYLRGLVKMCPKWRAHGTETNAVFEIASSKLNLVILKKNFSICLKGRTARVKFQH